MIKCYNCKYEDDEISSFPDLFYTDINNTNELN